MKHLIPLVLFLIATPALADRGELELAQEAALSWLALTDSQQLELSWKAASPFFQAAISESDWTRSLTAAHTSFGKLKNRKVAAATFSKTLPGAVNAHYIIFQFNTTFEKESVAAETLSMIKGSDKLWRVAAYVIE